MYCASCGHRLNKSDNFCTACGKKTTAVEEITVDRPVDQPRDETLSEFSWGYLGMPFLYAAFMKFPPWLIAASIVIQSLPTLFGVIGAFIYFALAFMVAYEARKIAHNGKRKFKSNEEFETVQWKWDAWGIVATVLSIIYLFVAMINGDGIDSTSY